MVGDQEKVFLMDSLQLEVSFPLSELVRGGDIAKDVLQVQSGEVLFSGWIGH